MRGEVKDSESACMSKNSRNQHAGEGQVSKTSVKLFKIKTTFIVPDLFLDTVLVMFGSCWAPYLALVRRLTGSFKLDA